MKILVVLLAIVACTVAAYSEAQTETDLQEAQIELDSHQDEELAEEQEMDAMMQGLVDLMEEQSDIAMLQDLIAEQNLPAEIQWRIGKKLKKFGKKIKKKSKKIGKKLKKFGKKAGKYIKKYGPKLIKAGIKYGIPIAKATLPYLLG